MQGANWLDLVLGLLTVLAVIVGFKRGFGRAIFDFAAVILAVRIAYLAYTPLSESIRFSSDPQANLVWSYALTFFVSGIILWFIGKLAYDTTLISLDTFDPALGAVLGFGIAVVLGHVFASTMFIATAVEGASQLVRESMLAPEFHTFASYHDVIGSMKRLGD